MTCIRIVAVAAGVACLCGCSSRTGGPGDVVAAPPVLNELHELLIAAGRAKGRPPAQLSDLDSKKTLYPRAYEAVKNGDIVVLWGAPPKGEGSIEQGGTQEIVAYEKNVPTQGGWALFSAGAVKIMTSAEFNSAPKAGKP